MKRRISLLLAVVMILGTFSFAFAADVNEKVDLVTKEGILRGDQGTNALRLDDPLARKEAVVLLSRLMDVEEEANNFEKEGLPTFADVQDAVYYKSFIAWAEDNKYFDGNPDGTFGFNDNLTVKQYAAVLLRALGYAEEVYNVEGWKNVEKLANDLNLLEDVETELNDDATRREVAVMTFNALGAKMKDSDKTLAEFLGIEMPAPAELKAEVNDTENLKEVIVELSNAKLADQEKLTNAYNYRLAGNEVERVEVKDNNVLVQVKNPLRDGKQYELQIKGVDKAVDGKYKFVARDNTIPAVEKVEVLGEYGIKIETTEPIDAARSNNFLVDGKNVTMDIEQYGRYIILTPYRGSFPAKAETLTVKELKDFAGFKSAKQDFDIEIVKDNEAPEVVDVVLKGNKVEVVFDKDIYIDSVGGYWNRSDVGNISYELGRHTVYASYEGSGKADVNKAVYTFKDNEVPSRRDKLTIEGVTNHSDVKMEKTTMVAREVSDDSEPEILTKKMTAKDTTKGTATVKLYFNKDVQGSFKNKDKITEGFVVGDHFRLYEDEVSRRNEITGRIISAEYDYDEKEDKILKDVIVVKFKDLEEYHRVNNDLEYILEIEGFADAASSRNKMYRDYYEFKFTKVTDFAVSKASVSYKGDKETEITLTFNKYLDRDLAEKATNYIFYTEKDGKKTSRADVADLDGYAELVGNGTKVILTIPEAWKDLKDDYAGLRILDAIKDTGGNRLGKDYYFDFKLEELVDEDEEVQEKQTLEEAETEVKKVVTGTEPSFGEVNAETKEADVLAAVKKVVTNDDITVTIYGFEVKAATESEAGYVKGTVLLKLDDGEKTVDFDLPIEKLPLAAPEDGLEELAVEDLIADDVKFLVKGLGEPQEPSSLNQVAGFMMSEYGVTFNQSAIKIEDGKISIVGSILSTEDWNTVKDQGGDKTKPYRITVLNNGVKVAKIAMYEDGVAVIEKL